MKKRATPELIESFIRSVSTDVGYNEAAKVLFHKRAEQILLLLGDALGLVHKQDYDLRHNQGGIAVSGEITLHSDTLYIQFSQGHCDGDRFLWRVCNGRKDYRGLANQWMSWDSLRNIQGTASVMKAYVARSLERNDVNV